MKQDTHVRAVLDRSRADREGEDVGPLQRNGSGKARLADTALPEGDNQVAVILAQFRQAQFMPKTQPQSTICNAPRLLSFLIHRIRIEPP